jgi:hypothetical protein
MRHVRSDFYAGFWLLACGFFAVSGCTQQAATTQPTTRPSTLKERQDAAMRDPFGYSPNAGRTDVSGGGLTDFDRDGFNRDLKNALDP